MTEEVLRFLADLAASTGTTAYVVGGFVRDKLLGREPIDLDLLLEGNPRDFLAGLVARTGGKPAVVPREHPATYRTALLGWLIDISACGPGQLGGEMARRDFTINAMAVPLRPGGLSWDQPIDPVGGMTDLMRRRIRHVSPRGLDSDPLRLLRAVRLATLLDDFTLDAGLADAIRRGAANIVTAAAERIAGELGLILSSPRAGAGLRMMKDLGLLFPIFPALRPLAGLQQNRWHSHDVLEHTLCAVEAADLLHAGDAASGAPPPADDDAVEALKWSVLLHDTGKAATARTDQNGEVHFHGHEWVSAEITRRALTDLRLSRARTHRIARLVQNHLRLPLLAQGGDVSAKAIRRLVHQMEHDTPLLCLLALSDRRSAGGQDDASRTRRLDDLVGKVMHVLAVEGDRLIAPTPLVTGHDVMHILAIGPGPRVGSVLRWLTRLQVDRRISSRDEAIALMRSLPPPQAPPGRD
ncbi:MAG: HD domain-containing protein [Acidobacteriota bacterium]